MKPESTAAFYDRFPELRKGNVAKVRKGKATVQQEVEIPGVGGRSIHPMRHMDSSSKPKVLEAPGMSEMERRLNKTEKRFLAELRRRGYTRIGIQEVTLRLAWDTRYTPDFDTGQGGGHTFWEVKGFMRDDARVKLFTAAAKYTYWSFVLVEWKGGQWVETLVKG